jgi:hypothetical protein
MMPRTIFGPKREEVKVGLGKCYNEEITNLYCSPNVINSDQIKGNELSRFSSKRKERGMHRGVSLETRRMESTTTAREENVKMNLRELGWGYGLDVTSSG